jgi:hypothetical protein
MFFQALLLLGYLYAHIITTKLKIHSQVILHMVVLAAGFVFARVLPDGDWAPSGQEQPTIHLLSILLIHVGPSFFALSTTAPLIQSWFYRSHSDRSPYPLYSISNAGSLIASLSYPFVVEPMFALKSQENIWFAGYGVFFLGCAYCAIRMWRVPSPVQATPLTNVATEDNLDEPSVLTWFALSACGSILLLTTTDQISQDVAASPLFWIVPLCLYLLSFILCFAKDSFYSRKLWLPTLPIAICGVASLLMFGSKWPVAIQLGIYTITLFIGCMVCHGELAHCRPDARRLTAYYLATSAGGVVGGLFVAIIAPLIFPGMWEYSLGWLGLATLVLVILSRDPQAPFHQKRSGWIWVSLGAAWVVAVVCFSADLIFDHREASITSRNFFGRLAVSNSKTVRCLYHGRIQHGCQWLDQERAFEPTTYYAAGSGIGVAIPILRKQNEGKTPRSLQIGVVGLGVGTCATWAKEEDTVHFFELNPEVVRYAKEQFTYLRDASAKTKITIGDARISLTRELENGNVPKFDLLVLDAFSGDAVPLHLLTREAFEIYFKRLKPGGVLAAHISNRYLDLEPLLLGLAMEAKKKANLVYTRDDITTMTYASTWVLVTDNTDFIAKAKATGHLEPWPKAHATPVVFTDQYSNLLELLR